MLYNNFIPTANNKELLKNIPSVDPAPFVVYNDPYFMCILLKAGKLVKFISDLLTT